MLRFRGAGRHGVEGGGPDSRPERSWQEKGAEEPWGWGSPRAWGAAGRSGGKGQAQQAASRQAPALISSQVRLPRLPC